VRKRCQSAWRPHPILPTQHCIVALYFSPNTLRRGGSGWENERQTDKRQKVQMVPVPSSLHMVDDGIAREPAPHLICPCVVRLLRFVEWIKRSNPPGHVPANRSNPTGASNSVHQSVARSTQKIVVGKAWPTRKELGNSQKLNFALFQVAGQRGQLADHASIRARQASQASRLLGFNKKQNVAKPAKWRIHHLHKRSARSCNASKCVSPTAREVRLYEKWVRRGRLPQKAQFRLDACCKHLDLHPARQRNRLEDAWRAVACMVR